MRTLLTILEFLTGVAIVFGLGYLLAHLFKLDLFFKNRKDEAN